jgi:hypothetical protein
VSFKQLLRWFNSNLLSFNLKKTHFIHFKTRNASLFDIQIGYHNNLITNIHHTKFLGITIQNTLSRNTHLDHLTTKLSTASYAIRTIKPFTSVNTLITVYHAYSHSLMSYGLILWGSSSYSINIFRLQKKAIRIITGISKRFMSRLFYKTQKTTPSITILIIHTIVCSQ